MSTELFVLGIHMWSDTTQKLNAMEDTFSTIATVTQIEDSMETEDIWDAGLQKYSHSDYPVYYSVISEDVLEFEDANYLKKPEKRPYYGAHMPGYRKMFDAGKVSLSDRYFIVEFSPVEDCIPNHPVLVNIERVLQGETYGSKQLWYCDHYTENPKPLYAGKTYIAWLTTIENTHENAQIGTQVESVSMGTPIFSSQHNKTGELLESELNLDEIPVCEEVKKNFYKTGRGKYWINFIKSLRLLDESIPVLPTKSLELLFSFHEGEAAIIDGREISDEEFQDGKAVCLVTTDFAQSNGLTVGDTISLPLYFANYRTDPSYLFGYGYGALDFSLLNAKGEPYSCFWEDKYEIVGTYRYSGGKLGGPLDKTEMARDLVIIPTKSIRASDENNIVDFGPMSATTTSFQIPNGSIAQFEEALINAVSESSFLEITYDDNGYEQISKDLKSTRDIALLLSVIGLLSTFAILILLLYFFVVKQKKRTAIERSLGLSRKQCRISIISGIMALTVIATVLGSIGSTVLINYISITKEADQEKYSTMYSSWTLNEDTLESEKFDTETSNTLWYLNIIIIPVLLCSFMLISSVILVNRNLDIEPIILLSTKGD